VFDRLQAASLKLKPSKCALLQPEFKYLGQVSGTDKIATQPKKVRDVKDWAVPLDLHKLPASFELVGYYRQCIPNFTKIAQLSNWQKAKEFVGSRFMRSSRHLNT